MKKKADQQTKAAIESAVNSIADKFSDIKRTESSDRKRYTEFNASQKHTAVFVGVMAFVLLIGSIWIINLKQFFTLLEFTGGSEHAILESTKDDFSSIFEELGRKEDARVATDKATAAAAIGSALENEENKIAVRAALDAAFTSTTTPEN